MNIILYHTRGTIMQNWIVQYNHPRKQETRFAKFRWLGPVFENTSRQRSLFVISSKVGVEIWSVEPSLWVRLQEAGTEVSSQGRTLNQREMGIWTVAGTWSVEYSQSLSSELQHGFGMKCGNDAGLRFPDVGASTKTRKMSLLCGTETSWQPKMTSR